MQSTIEQTDVSEPASAGTPATLTDERGDAPTTTTSALHSHSGGRRRRAVLRTIAASAAIGAAAAAIAIAVIDRSGPDQAPLTIPGLIEAPPMAEPQATSAATGMVPVLIEAPPMAEPQATSAATGMVPVLIEAPPMAEPQATSAATGMVPVLIEAPPMAEPQAAPDRPERERLTRRHQTKWVSRSGGAHGSQHVPNRVMCRRQSRRRSVHFRKRPRRGVPHDGQGAGRCRWTMHRSRPRQAPPS